MAALAVTLVGAGEMTQEAVIAVDRNDELVWTNGGAVCSFK